MAMDAEVQSLENAPSPSRQQISQFGRLRTPVACQVCRDKKVKCSGKVPCDYCASHEIQCILPRSNRRRMYSVAKIKELRRKAALYENYKSNPPEQSPALSSQGGDGGNDEYSVASEHVDILSRQPETIALPRGRPRAKVDPCRFCNKGFRRSEHLRRHERIHTQEKPFECHCGQCFSRQDLLLRHTRIVHTENIENSNYTLVRNRANNKPQHRNSDGGQSDAIDTSKTTGLEPLLPLSNNSEITQIPTMENTNFNEAIGQAIEANLGQRVEQTETVGLEDGLLVATGHSASTHRALHENSFFPPMEDFTWWDSQNLMDSFLPTELLDTDLPLSNLTGDGLLQHNAALYGFAREPVAHSNLSNSVVCDNETQELSTAVESHDLTAVVERDPNTHRGALLPDRGSLASLGQELTATNDLGQDIPWKISPAIYDLIRAGVTREAWALPPDFAMPLRHPLCRYLEGYFRGFHNHLPFFHLPTLSLSAISVELLLAIAAVGALYKFEHGKGYSLFYAAKSIISHKLQQRRRESAPRTRQNLPGYAYSETSDSSPPVAAGLSVQNTTFHSDNSSQLTPTIQALNILMAMASWGEEQLLPEGFEMAGQLATLVRMHGISRQDPIPLGCAWHYWARCEEKRRTLYVSYILLNLQSIAFDVPPVILNQEIGLFLPHHMDLWRAPTAASWADARRSCNNQEVTFQGLLDDLLRGKAIHHGKQLSAFSNYLLIHGLIQLIFFERQTSACRINNSPSLSHETLKVLEVALRGWQQSWESTAESTLDPLSPKGPLAFNSSALLRIAYVRLNANLGPHRSLRSHFPEHLASCIISDSIIIERSVHTDRAVLQCIHALGIIVRAGVAFTARTHTQSWSIVHSLGNIECACLLNCWLRTIASCIQNDGLITVRQDERALLGMVSGLVSETEFGQELCAEESEYLRARRLAVYTVRLWSEAFKGVHVFQMVHVVAQGLSIAADMLENTLQP